MRQALSNYCRCSALTGHRSHLPCESCMNNQEIVIAGQRPKPRVVAGRDCGSPTWAKAGFMKDSTRIFDTHRLSLRIRNFEKPTGVKM
jgi:hypothetical protein